MFDCGLPAQPHTRVNLTDSVGFSVYEEPIGVNSVAFCST